MDLADDVAYSVHDIEDGVVAGRVDLSRLDRAAVWDTVRSWYLPDLTDAALDAVLDELVAIPGWPTSPYDGSRRSLAALKNLTSDVIGRFCGAVQEATFAGGPGPFVRYESDLVVPTTTAVEIGVLKGIAAHYVMQADDRVAAMVRQRELLAELAGSLADSAPDGLERPVRRRLARGRRRRRAAARGGRPGRLAHRRQCARVARPVGRSGQVAARVGVVLVHQALVRQRVRVGRPRRRPSPWRPRPRRRSCP